MKKRVFLVVLALAISACNASKPTNPTPPPNGEVSYSAIGASDAIGYGSSRVCLPLSTCPDGNGYVQVLVRRLQTAGRTVTLLNLGIPGAVLSQEIQTIGNSLGRGIPSNFLQQQMPFVSRDSTLVTVFAGGNDVNTIGASLDAGWGGTDMAGYVNQQSQNFGRDLRALVTGVKGRAPLARIIIFNLPNLAALPYVSGQSVDRKRWLQMIAVGFSAQINALVADGAQVIDLMCDANMYQPSILSSDGFHPNDAGYAYLAELLYAAFVAGTSPAPRASCSQMTIF